MKKLFMVITCIITGLAGYCQTTTDPLREKLDSIFQHVDKTQIPTGYLKEYGAELSPINRLNGVLTDSNVVGNLDHFRIAYSDLTSSRLPQTSPSSNLLDLSQVNDMIDIAKNNMPASVAVLYGRYASLKSTSLTENLFTLTNEQLYDVPGRNASPYISNTLFAVAAIGKKYVNTVTLLYNPTLYFSNTTDNIVSLSVDFLDGNGYNPIDNIGITSKTYTDSSGYKQVVFKATMNTGAILFCKSYIYVEVTASTLARYIDTDPYAREIPIRTLSATSTPYNDYDDKLQIRYAKNNPTRTNSDPTLRYVRKPLIYVEGYDVSGSYDITNLIRTDPLHLGEWVKLALNPFPNGYDFMNYLDDVAGYDLIFVNYNTLRGIPENASMLEEVIKWANRQKQLAGAPPEKNVVIGVSAGGLVARYCLANMTKNNIPTDTKLLVTHDSPHQGANVPLAFQHFLYDLGGCKVLGKEIKYNLPDLFNFYILNLQPATAQLLRARVLDDNGSVAFNTFLDGPMSPYQQKVTFVSSDPQPSYRFVATAQGSQCGIPVMPSNGLSLANYDGPFTLINFVIPVINLVASDKYYLTTQLTSLPSNGNSGQIEYFKFVRKISFFGIPFQTKTIKNISRPNPPGFTEWDAVAGSTQSISGRTKGNLTSGLQPQSQGDFLDQFIQIRGGLNMNITNDLFSFVSTTSALDAPVGTPSTQPFIFPLNGPTVTSADKYIAQQKNGLSYNLNHTDYTARNANWIFDEMEGIDDCDLNAQYINDCNNFQIAGPDIFCETSTYSLITQASTPVSWSATPANAVSFSCTTCNTTNITKLIDADIILTATISTCATGVAPITFIKHIHVGFPTITPIISHSTILKPVIGSTTFMGTVSVSNYRPGNTYLWKINGVQSNQTGSMLHFPVGPCLNGFTFRDYNITVYVENVCGFNSSDDAAIFRYYCSPTPTLRYLREYNNCLPTLQFPNPPCSPLNRQSLNRFTIFQDPENLTSLVTATITYTEDEFSKLFFDASALQNELVESVNIYDLTGNLVKETTNIDNTKTSIDLSDLPEGTYNVQIAGLNDYVEQQTFKYTISNSDVELAEDIVKDSVVFAVADSIDRLEVLKQQLYKELRTNDDLLKNSEVLQSFFASQKLDDIGKINDINDALAVYDIQKAQLLMLGWQPKNRQGVNCLDYYNYFISYLNGYTFTSEDIDALYILANGCPDVDGEIVFAARSLYNYITELNEEFPYACGYTASRGIKKHPTAKVQSPGIIIYPNPSNGNFYVRFPAKTRGTNNIRITSSSGRVIMQQTVIAGTQNLNIHKVFSTGIYLIQITNNITGKTETKKLVIKP